MQPIVGIVTGVIALAAIAVILSNSSNTTNVVLAGSNGLSNLLKAALLPIGY